MTGATGVVTTLALLAGVGCSGGRSPAYDSGATDPMDGGQQTDASAVDLPDTVDLPTFDSPDDPPISDLQTSEPVAPNDAGGERPQPTFSICDGTAAVRLMYIATAQLGPVAKGSQVIYENGARYLFVNGLCHFWAFDEEEQRTSSALVDIMEGDLSPADATTLAAELRVDEWPAQAGRHTGPQLSDAGWNILWIPGTEIECQIDCSWTGSPEILKVAFARAHQALRTLSLKRSPVNAAVRIYLTFYEGDIPWKHPFLDWPLTNPLTGYERPYVYAPVGSGILVPQPDAALLRTLRREWRGKIEANEFDFVPIRGEGGKVYRLYARDVIPLERADGTISRPPG